MYSNVKREKNRLCPCNAWVVSSKCTLTAPRPELCSRSLRSDVKCGWEWEWTLSLRWGPVGVILSLGYQERRLYDLKPWIPHGLTSAGACFLSSGKHFHIKRWCEGQTHPGQRSSSGRLLPAYTTTVIGSFTRLWDQLVVSQTQCTTNAQAVLKQRFSRFVFAAKLYYFVQRWQKYSHCVLQFKCGYLCKIILQ